MPNRGAARGTGFAEPEAAREAELAAAERALRQETGDDRETEQREATAATVAGAWLKNFADEVDTEIQGIERALEALGFDLERLAPGRPESWWSTRVSIRSSI